MAGGFYRFLTRNLRALGWVLLAGAVVVAPVTWLTAAPSNHLASSKSPYLQEHATDPVDWYPWGPEAFELAKRQNKLIFLSIGYSSCHWCHVMQKEDFEDSQVAKLLNQSFVSILVDREERPDIDNQYMAVCEMLTGSGGWPLVVILTPGRQPFFASTYLPRESTGGREGMLELLPKIARQWQSNPGSMVKNGEKLSRLLQQALVRGAPSDLPGRDALRAAYRQLDSSFDSRHGGFGSAPKFPPALDILFLLRYWKPTGDAKALAMAEKTLDAMRAGGIFDQVGFGFHRYATDVAWRMPHFEKMLYDQALIAMAYTETYQATHEERFERTAREIFTYVLRDLASPHGAFYDAQDADSAGREGAFYLWTEKQIHGVLSPQDAELVLKVFDVPKDGNFPAAGEGENILYLRHPLDRTAAELKISPRELGERLESARARLFAAREKRVHPRKDTKILTGWNGLMIAALAKAAQAFGDPRYARAGEQAADFILKNMRASNGRLLHSGAGEAAPVPANLNDYAFFTLGLTELYEADFNVSYLESALALDSEMVDHFWDAKNGGFFFTADDDQNDLVREKNMNDADLPAGNSVAALDLLRLGEMTGDHGLVRKGEATLRAFAGEIRKAPGDYPEALTAADFALGPVYEVVIAGDSRAAGTRQMLKAVQAPFVPNKVVLLRPTETPAPPIVRLADYTRFQKGVDGKPTAYVCENYTCKLPVTSEGKMLELLGLKSP
jgi:uncharacterized protein